MMVQELIMKIKKLHLNGMFIIRLKVWKINELFQRLKKITQKICCNFIIESRQNTQRIIKCSWIRSSIVNFICNINRDIEFTVCGDTHG